MRQVITVKDLHKQYGSHCVLKGVSFTVSKGQIFALLGTNGAGKTTTLECMEGIRRYESGDIDIQGRIGVQLQSSSLPHNIKAAEVLKLFAKWNRAPMPHALIQALGIDAFLTRQYRELSMGQQRRLHLALAMTGDPDILFLDEPTAGLDVEGRAAMHDEIRRFKQHGKTIVMASHDMAEVESLCDSIAILKNGRIAFFGPTETLTSKIKDIYQIQLKLSASLITQGLRYSTPCGQAQGYSAFETKELENGMIELLTLAKAQGAKVQDLKIGHASLEQRFLDIAKEETA